MLFPVLARVAPIARAAHRPRLEAPHRRALYRALVYFLERLAMRFTLVLSMCGVPQHAIFPSLDSAQLHAR